MIEVLHYLYNYALIDSLARYRVQAKFSDYGLHDYTTKCFAFIIYLNFIICTCTMLVLVQQVNLYSLSRSTCRTLTQV